MLSDNYNHVTLSTILNLTMTAGVYEILVSFFISRTSIKISAVLSLTENTVLYNFSSFGWLKKAIKCVFILKWNRSLVLRILKNRMNRLFFFFFFVIHHALYPGHAQKSHVFFCSFLHSHSDHARTFSLYKKTAR